MTLLVVPFTRHTHGPCQPSESNRSQKRRMSPQPGRSVWSKTWAHNPWVSHLYDLFNHVVGKQKRLGVIVFHRNISTTRKCWNPLFSISPATKPSGHRWALSLSLLEGSPLRRLEMTVVGSSAAISACASGPWQRALGLFDEWLGCDLLGPTGGFEVNKSTWNSCEPRLPQKDLTPDIIVCNSVLRACAFANAEHLERLLRISVASWNNFVVWFSRPTVKGF